MASGIPTRRPVRRADENAPPTTAVGAPSTRSRTSIAPALTAKTAGTTSSLPVMKRHHSSTAVVANGTKPDATKKRSALGEVTNAGKNVDKAAGLKGKAVKEERKPVAPQPRRTRSGLSTETKPKVEEAAVVKRRPVVPVQSRSNTASTSTAPLKEKVINFKEELVAEPVRKRRKTSTPPVVSEAEHETDDETPYDEDGREILLSSDGVSAQSPKRKSRAKDEGWTDLDAEDEGDPAMVSEYVVDAFNYMLEIEKRTMPNPNYMEKQAELQWKMRGVLMDWLVEVHSKFRLLPETLYIAINLIDRFLSARVISLVKFQLVGLTALFVAAKYEEVICPSISHFLHMAEGSYGIEEILKAERYMLSTLEFDISYPNPLHFMRRISKADGYDIQTRTVAKFLIEISCVEHKLLKYPPSMLAAAAMYLARKCLARGEWTPNHVHYSTYSELELVGCAQTMLDYILDPDLKTDSSFYRKYASKKHMKASIFVHKWALERFPDDEERGTGLEADIAFDSA